MSDPSLLFLFLVLPTLVVAVLTYLGILTIGLGPILAVFRSVSTPVKGVLIVLGVLVILSPVLFHVGMDLHAQHKADKRQAALAALERTSLAGKLPRHYIAVGGAFGPELHAFVQRRYGLRRLPEGEDYRVSQAYAHYREAERCHRFNPGNPMMPGTRLAICKRLPDSAHGALGLGEPILVFAEGQATSMREDNILAGKIYEIRLITPDEDLLVAYYEERTVEETPGIFNPYASGRRNASQERPPALKDFIETALEGASR